GKKAGTLGDIGCFSFYPGKNLGAFGDAGAMVTPSAAINEKLRLLINHGRTEKYVHLVRGFNYRLDTLQAAVLDVKLQRLEDWTVRRRLRAQQYHSGLEGTGLILPWEAATGRHVFHLYEVRTKKREQLKQYLAGQGVETGIHYPIPLHLQP